MKNVYVTNAMNTDAVNFNIDIIFVIVFLILQTAIIDTRKCFQESRKRENR